VLLTLVDVLVVDFLRVFFASIALCWLDTEGDEESVLNEADVAMPRLLVIMLDVM